MTIQTYIYYNLITTPFNVTLSTMVSILCLIL